jgi:NADPH2:quinone reductase
MKALHIMRAMSADRFNGYQDLRLVEIPKPAVSDERVLVRLTAAGVTTGKGPNDVCSQHN